MKQQFLVKFFVSAWLLLSLASCGPVEPTQITYDIIFENGRVVDGTGGPSKIADIAVQGGIIVAIGKLAEARANTRLDVSGLVIAPGFIDVHSHAEEALIDPALRSNKGFITQGVTTTVFGVDGGHAPRTLNTIRDLLETQGVGTNFLFYVGHNGIREEVMAMADRPPTAEELESMKAMVRAAMQQGAVGLSSGLMYLPGRFAKTEEIVELARVVAEFDGLYDSHVRDPASALLDSIQECLDIASKAGIHAHPAHIKAVGGKNFGVADNIVAMVEAAQSVSQEVTADLYPYDGAAARNLLDLLVMPSQWPEVAIFSPLTEQKLTDQERTVLQDKLDIFWRSALHDPTKRLAIKEATEHPPNGVFSWIEAVGYSSFRIVVAGSPNTEGRMVLDLATERAITPFDLLAELIVAEGRRPKLTLGAIQEEDIRTLIRQPWVMISSDGREAGTKGQSGHPRFRGSFPRVLGKYVREWGVLSLEEAVRKMTSLPAEYLRLKNRGSLHEGYVADLAIFDPQLIDDRSTWAEPWLYSQGMVHVLVNGGFAMRDGEMTGNTFGAFIPFKK